MFCHGKWWVSKNRKNSKLATIWCWWTVDSGQWWTHNNHNNSNNESDMDKHLCWWWWWSHVWMNEWMKKQHDSDFVWMGKKQKRRILIKINSLLSNNNSIFFISFHRRRRKNSILDCNQRIEHWKKIVTITIIIDIELNDDRYEETRVVIQC